MKDQRTKVTRKLDNYEDVRQLLYSLASEFSTAFIYDTCSSTVANDQRSYELLVALGARSHFKLSKGQPLLELEEWMVNTEGWKFGGFSYDLKNKLEDLDSNNADTMEFPDAWFAVPEHIITISTDKQEITIESDDPDILSRHNKRNLEAKTSIELSSTVTKPAYLKTIDDIREQIRAGNVYELNYCIQFDGKIEDAADGLSLFSELVEISPVPFAAYARFDHWEVISASPERYMLKKGRKIVSQPIKGTRDRSDNENTDLRNRQGLQNSIKDRAENVMIVDLVRNDLARTCKPGTVKVEEIFGIYAFPQVFQMISTISGVLEDEVTDMDVIRNSFPMGSMTGAPKIAAMKLIEEFEDFKRNWYSGSLGYISPDGDFDFNVLIRSLFINRELNSICYAVGGAITIDSEPDQEYEECMWKAKAIRRLLGD